MVARAFQYPPPPQEHDQDSYVDALRDAYQFIQIPLDEEDENKRHEESNNIQLTDNKDKTNVLFFDEYEDYLLKTWNQISFVTLMGRKIGYMTLKHILEKGLAIDARNSYA